MDKTPCRILLVGHCGPDTSYLRISIASALPGAKIDFANDESELKSALRDGIDLALINRVLDGMFSMHGGVDLIRTMKQAYPNVKTMLVSNYPEAHADAIAAGALPGFGKRQLGSKELTQLLRDATENCQPSPT